MKTRSTIPLLLALWLLQTTLSAQPVQIELPLLNGGTVTRSNLQRIAVGRVDGHIDKVDLVVTLYDGNNAKVYECRFDDVLLATTGVRPLNPSTTLKQESFEGTAGDVLQRQHVLPAGRYLARVEAFDVGGARVGERTEEFEATPQLPPRLYYPFDGDSIRTLHPLLQWIPPQPVADGSVRYDLTLVEVGEGQSSMQSIVQNSPMLRLDRVNALQHPYAPHYSSLRYGHTYAWKIYAYGTDGTFFGETDVWTFTPVRDTVEEKKPQPVHIVSSHWLTQSHERNGFFRADSLLRFTYENKYGLDSLVYTVEAIDGSSPVGTLPTVTLTDGLNYISLDVEPLTLAPDRYYLLTAINPDRSIRKVKFYKSK